MGLADRDYMKNRYYRHNRYRPPRRLIRRGATWKRVSFTKKKGLILSIVWFLVLLFITPLLEAAYTHQITEVGAIFIVVSFVLGIYNAYPFAIWIDRKIPNTDFGIWMRRIVAGIMFLGGFWFGILMLVSFALSTAELSLRGVKAYGGYDYKLEEK